MIYRPLEMEEIYGDPAKTKEILNWNYDLDFLDVIDLIIDEEMRNLMEEKHE
jgi:GDPmannose 4,6-dehydratase